MMSKSERHQNGIICATSFSSINRREISSIECDDGSSHSADVFVMATGIESAPMARKIGVNIPVYPMRGNILTIPLKVSISRLIVITLCQTQSDYISRMITITDDFTWTFLVNETSKCDDILLRSL
jgi:glycine/D-amino acid oxidase-like deaminating enzyme